MRDNKALGFVAIGLVAGLVLGSIGIAAGATSMAATSTATTATAGQPGMRGPGGPGGLEGRGGGDIAEALASLTDLSVSDIESQRAAGKSYAAIAKAEGVSTDKLIAATVKIETAELDADVKAGTITSAQRTQVLSGLKAFLTTEIARTDSRGPGGPGGPGGQPPATNGSTNTQTAPSTNATL